MKRTSDAADGSQGVASHAPAHEPMGLTEARPLAEAKQDARLRAAFVRERGRLRSYIRARLAEPMDAEDILQDVFTELVLAYRLARPIEHLSGWLFQVARNRLADRSRKRRRDVSLDATSGGVDGSALADLLPSRDAGPEAIHARGVLLRAIEDALAELPRAQREVFIAHELDGRSFGDIAAETGVRVNTLLSRKRYAVLHLRRRLRPIHDDFAGKDL